MGNLYRIVFEYADALSGYGWRKQECQLYGKDPNNAVEKCIDLYGLGKDCDFHIIEVEMVK